MGCKTVISWVGVFLHPCAVYEPGEIGGFIRSRDGPDYGHVSKSFSSRMHREIILSLNIKPEQNENDFGAF